MVAAHCAGLGGVGCRRWPRKAERNGQRIDAGFWSALLARDQFDQLLVFVLWNRVAKHDQIEVDFRQDQFGFENSAGRLHLEVGAEHQSTGLQQHLVAAYHSTCAPWFIEPPMAMEVNRASSRGRLHAEIPTQMSSIRHKNSGPTVAYQT